MKKKVRILPETLINKIAAGEVVERPSSVVKELLENSIDAGATDIKVTVKNGGKDLISIIDNGCGMNENDAQISIERHATSKIFEEIDLFHIETLGFRGEALSAIASVSHFELITCDNTKNSGTRLYIRGGNIEDVGKIGFPQGTKITVERLFFNTPARLKFLKTNNTELKHIKHDIIQKSLAHPNISFRLTHNQQMLLNFTGTKELGIRIKQIFGENIKEILVAIRHEEIYLKFSGFISIPSKPRTSRRWQYIFVNGRNVRSQSVNHGIYDGYGTFLGKGQHPAFFLDIIIDPTEIDVNVHPAKTEIRFRNSHLIHTILVDQISRSLKESASLRFFGQDHLYSQMPNVGLSGQIELPMGDSLNIERQSYRKKISKSTKLSLEDFEKSLRDSKKHERQLKKPFTSEKNIFDDLVFMSEKSGNSKTTKTKFFQNSEDFCSSTEIGNLSLFLSNPEVSSKIRVLGQFRETYIIAEDSAGLLVFEQMKLHERLLYEIHKRSLQKNEVPFLKLKTPLLIELSSEETDLLNQFLEFFVKSGFEISHFGGTTFSVNTNPKILFPDRVNNVIREFLSRVMIHFKEDDESKNLSHISYAVALHGRLKSCQELTITEMECLLALWEEFGYPKISLSEKPILVELSDKELERRLKL